MIEFDVIGIPAPQGSKTAIMRPGMARPVLVEGKGNQRVTHKTWRQAVMVAGQDWLIEHPAPPIDEPIALYIRFRMERPAAAQYRTRHASAPDLSKLIRSTEDALTNSQLIRDDSRVCYLGCSKRYVQPGELPGCTITIHLLGEKESQDRENMKAAAKRERLTLKS